MTLQTISKRYHKIARSLNAPKMYVRFATSPQHDGSPHVESYESEFHYVLTERGSEFERRKTSRAEELLFWLVSDLTWAMAEDWELQHRNEKEDFRRQLFQKDVELISQVSDEWGQRKKAKYEKVLEGFPFEDLIPN